MISAEGLSRLHTNYHQAREIPRAFVMLAAAGPRPASEFETGRLERFVEAVLVGLAGADGREHHLALFVYEVKGRDPAHLVQFGGDAARVRLSGRVKNFQ